MGLCETRIRHDDGELEKVVGIHATTVSVERSHRGFGGVSFIVNSIISIEALNQKIQPAYQSTTMRSVGIILTETYISHNVLQVDEKTLLICVGKTSRV